MKEAFLRGLPFYQHLTEPQKELIAANCYGERYQAGEIIYTPAKNCTGLMQVKKGGIRTYLLSPEGKKATIFRLREGEFCVLSMTCVLSAITFDVEVEATEDCELMLLPAPIFHQVEQENIYVKNFNLEVVMERFSALVEAMQQIMFLTLEQRLVSYLLDESSERRSDMLEITQEQVAENIGSAREAVSRGLKKLKEKGILRVGRGYVELLDKKELYRLLA